MESERSKNAGIETRRGPEIVLGVRRTLSTVHKGTCTMPATRYGSAVRVTIAVSAHVTADR